MKRFLMLVGVAAVAGAMYVAAAPGSRQATGPTAQQFATLKREVTSLSKKLSVLTKDEKSVKALAVNAGGFISDCFLKAGVAPVTQFGDVNGTFGFEYAAVAGANPTPRTGLDLDTGATPQGFLQGVDPSCVTTSSGAPHASTHSGSSHLPLRAERSR